MQITRPDQWERRVMTEKYSGPPDERAEALVEAWRAIDRGECCQQCCLQSRRPRHVAFVDGHTRALCEDCYSEVEMQRISDRIHGRR